MEKNAKIENLGQLLETFLPQADDVDESGNPSEWSKGHSGSNWLDKVT